MSIIERDVIAEAEELLATPMTSVRFRDAAEPLLHALCATVRALREMAYVPKILPDDDDLTYQDEVGRLLRQNTALREQLAHWQDRTRERTGEVERLQSELAQREQEWKAFENLGKRVEADLRAQLAQVTQERDELRVQLQSKG